MSVLVSTETAVDLGSMLGSSVPEQPVLDLLVHGPLGLA
jgi:hypothetical protein